MEANADGITGATKASIIGLKFMGADGGDASEDADEWSEERRRFVLGIARRGRASILKTIATSLDEEAPEDIRRHRRGSSKDAVEGCTLS